MKIIITGCTGKVGKSLISLIHSPECNKKFEIVYGVTHSDHSHLGQKIFNHHEEQVSNAEITDNLARCIEKCDVVIDFSNPEAAIHFAEISEVHGKPFISGTTGFSEEQMKKLNQISKRIPLFWSPNMSILVNLFARIVEMVAQKLKDPYDIEIIDMHHNEKIDAPSGTALALGNAAAKGRGISFEENATFARFGKVGKRIKGNIGFSVVRGGDVNGEHSVIFAGNGERLEISHKSTDRTIIARSALEAATWLATQKPGRVYNVSDIVS